MPRSLGSAAQRSRLPTQPLCPLHSAFGVETEGIHGRCRCRAKSRCDAMLAPGSGLTADGGAPRRLVVQPVCPANAEIICPDHRLPALRTPPHIERVVRRCCAASHPPFHNHTALIAIHSLRRSASEWPSARAEMQCGQSHWMPVDDPDTSVRRWRCTVRAAVGSIRQTGSHRLQWEPRASPHDSAADGATQLSLGRSLHLRLALPIH